MSDHFKGAGSDGRIGVLGCGFQRRWHLVIDTTRGFRGDAGYCWFQTKGIWLRFGAIVSAYEIMCMCGCVGVGVNA